MRREGKRERERAREMIAIKRKDERKGKREREKTRERGIGGRKRRDSWGEGVYKERGRYELILF